MEKRLTWDQYFMEIAETTAKRSTCPRRSVGAVLVRNNRILSTGYNGSIPGDNHCVAVGCILRDDHCKRVVHAELNAILNAASAGILTSGSTCYTTTYPCYDCFKAIASAGIVEVKYSGMYRPDNEISKLLRAHSLENIPFISMVD